MKGRVLVHNGKYVDVERLREGIFYTKHPVIWEYIMTIQEMIEEKRNVMSCTPEREFEISNLIKCKLIKTSTKYG